MSEDAGYWETRYDMQLSMAPWAFLLIFVAFLMAFIASILFGAKQSDVELLAFVSILTGMIAGICHFCRWRYGD